MVENVFADGWDQEQAQPGYTWKRKFVGRRLGGELIGASVFELAPGEKSFPYHWHHANEELLLVLEGSPTLRSPEGERELAPGDVVLFRRGQEGAHQLRNDHGAAARVLIVSTLIEPEVAEYPDSGKIGTISGPVDARTLRRFFRASDEVEYFDAEP